MQQLNKSDMTCYNCRQKGHISRNCTKSKPLWKKAADNATIGMTLVTDTDIYDFITAEDWSNADSGSTVYITSHFKYFTS